MGTTLLAAFVLLFVVLCPITPTPKPVPRDGLDTDALIPVFSLVETLAQPAEFLPHFLAADPVFRLQGSVPLIDWTCQRLQ